MNLTIATYDQSTELFKQMDQIVIDGFPEFSLHSETIDKYFSGLFKHFPKYQFVMHSHEVVKVVGNCMPLYWEGELDRFPEGGIEWGLETAAKQASQNNTPCVLCALQIVVAKDATGSGLSYRAVETMIELARSNGLKALIAPVRPNRKAKHPQIPMEEYVARTRDDDLPYDDWLRVHVRLGGEILNVCPRSEIVRGSVEQWQKWTGQTFEESGQYEIKGGLVPITIDMENDCGISIEPNIWVVHRI